MRSMRLVLAGLATAILLSAGCQSPNPTAQKSAEKQDLRLLADRLTGSFSSAEQAAADPENYKDIRLHMIPIWTERTDGPWLYVEQALATTMDQPYRQRVYRVSIRTDGAYESAVYELPGDPLRLAGAWQTPKRFDELTPESLTPKTGCSMILCRWPDGAFVGGTVGQGCTSSLRGAAYAMSEATITATGMVTWDRGYDANDQQVWGATKGGYEFKRVAP